jgi:transposase
MTKKNAKRRRHSAEFKAEAVRLVESRGDRTVGEIAQSLGVAESLLHIWKRQAEANGVAARDRGESVDQELSRLRRENADLKRDRDALVKSIAVVCHERERLRPIANYVRDEGGPLEIGLQGQVSNHPELRR